ncbi:MAG: hypothetical protein R3D30_14190 [Hyphomicrobiales bacterium]
MLGIGLLVGVAVLVSALSLATGDRAPRDESSQALSKPEILAGGETIISKLNEADEAKPTPVPAAKTAPHMTAPHMATLAPSLPDAEAKPDAEPNLSGLSEIPRELIWNRPPEQQDDEAKPKAFAAFSKAREELPWDAVEPVPFGPIAEAPEPTQETTGAAKPSKVAGAPVRLPEGTDVGAWVKSKVTEIKGADRQRPLYHFELWLDPPAEVRRRLVGVTYDFSTPAILPQTQASSDQASGFRISAGGLACADKVTLTLRFDDGRTEKVSLDGCKLFS